MWRYDDGALCHWGIKGMKWGVRRYQNKDGTLTAAGKKHYAGDGNAGSEDEPKVEYAPKRSGRNAEDYSDDELRSRINRLQMEKQYRDLQGQTNIRADDPNKELKAEKERLQLQKDGRISSFTGVLDGLDPSAIYLYPQENGDLRILTPDSGDLKLLFRKEA